MPFKSKAQARKLAELEKEGKVKAGTTKKWAAETGDFEKLPDRKEPIRSIAQIKVIARRKAK